MREESRKAFKEWWPDNGPTTCVDDWETWQAAIKWHSEYMSELRAKEILKNSRHE